MTIAMPKRSIWAISFFCSAMVPTFCLAFDLRMLENSTVQLQIEGETVKQGKIDNFGTGFFVSGNGDIVTTFHTLSQSSGTKVKWKRDTRGLPARKIVVWKKDSRGELRNIGEATLIDVDVHNNLAVLRVNAFETVGLSCSHEALRIGDEIIAAGFQHRKKDLDYVRGERQNNNVVALQNMWRISGVVQESHSGGPLVNEDGNVVGVIVAPDVREGTSFFAAPISSIAHLIPDSAHCTAPSINALSDDHAAISFDSYERVAGAAKASTARKARGVAIQRCIEKGGAEDRCKKRVVELDPKDPGICVSVSTNEDATSAARGHGSTEEIATRMAISGCTVNSHQQSLNAECLSLAVICR